MIKYNANENKELCEKCGGVCCKKSGCDTASSDFEKRNFDYLMKKLNEGKFSITAAFNPVQAKNGEMVNKPILYLRARNNGRGVVDLFSFRTGCSLLTSAGCSFDSEHRPAGGKNLIPGENSICRPERDPREIILTWRNYQDVLRKLVIHYTGLTPEEQYKVDVYDVFKKILTGNVTGISPLELADMADSLKWYIFVYPEEWDKASRECSSYR